MRRITPLGETAVTIECILAPSFRATPAPTMMPLLVVLSASSEPCLMSFSILVTLRSLSGSMPIAETETSLPP